MGSDPAFIKPGDQLDQGDIFRDVPWGLVEAPLTLCRPVPPYKPSGANARSGAPGDFSDAFRLDGGKELIHARGHKSLGVILWHGCQIDKFKNREAAGEGIRRDRAGSHHG